MSTLIAATHQVSDLGMARSAEAYAECQIDGKEVRLECTSSGHYCLPLSIMGDIAQNIVLTLDKTELLTVAEKKTKALKLHIKFGHTK